MGLGFHLCLKTQEPAPQQNKRLLVVGFHVFDDPGSGLSQRIWSCVLILSGGNPAHHAEAADVINVHNFRAIKRKIFLHAALPNRVPADYRSFFVTPAGRFSAFPTSEFHRGSQLVGHLVTSVLALTCCSEETTPAQREAPPACSSSAEE